VTIHTPRSRQAVGRRLDRRNRRLERIQLRVEEVVADMAAVLSLHRGLHRWKCVQWTLSDGEVIDDDIAWQVIQHSEVVPVGDCLFPETGEPSQTFRYVADDACAAHLRFAFAAAARCRWRACAGGSH
jgi:hypothetical protein